VGDLHDDSQVLCVLYVCAYVCVNGTHEVCFVYQ